MIDTREVCLVLFDSKTTGLTKSMFLAHAECLTE
eukprot:CAMPEP_0172600312 /NCGR_PEP_ID=MMETSP1068-20121228/20481_1 /TAXON_ID=35684 /ORGANISM="Pseudopedinella elastica, Strain CCMP716" /LENGTH=33 /DNA_ID= /DNA_START= /DNA_END= /DNA_ORIENTATION=